MTFIKQLEVLERLHLLIKRKATGTPEQLASRFNVSLGTIYNLIKILRNRNLPIAFCRERQTYYYEYDVEITIFHIKTKQNLQ
jgi:predicted DNA-binding transcriptional regulator YafY